MEVSNLQIEKGYQTYRFTAENGQQANYQDFSACLYISGGRNILVKNNVITDCSQAIFVQSRGAGDLWWDGLSKNITVSGNYFYNNGVVDDDHMHQTYIEADGAVYEYNHYGLMRVNSGGSQLKDRSAGLIIRTNYIEEALGGYLLDLVEPEEYTFGDGPGTGIGYKDTFKQAFVYGNNFKVKGNFIHWNQDHYNDPPRGRAQTPGGKLLYYHNTAVFIGNESEVGYWLVFNGHFGGWDCPPAPQPGIIDARNNIFVSLPRTAGGQRAPMEFGRCAYQNFTFGKNWVSPGWSMGPSAGTITGTNNFISPTNNDPGITDPANGDFSLKSTSSALGVGAALAPEVTSNFFGQDFSPTRQYLEPLSSSLRGAYGVGSDLGSNERP